MKKVLSVDDSGVMRRIIGRTVEVLGYGFREAANGVEAIEAVQSARPRFTDGERSIARERSLVKERLVS